MKYYKILKILPFVAIFLFLVIQYIWIKFFNSQQPDYLDTTLMQIVALVLIVLATLPSVILLFEILKNNKFREEALRKELNIKEKDEREALLVAKATKKAFASMHLAIWLTMAIYLPISILSGGLFYLDLVGINFGPVLLLVIPLAVGNYVFHQNLKELKAVEVDKKKWASNLFATFMVILLGKFLFDTVVNFNESRRFRKVDKILAYYCKDKNEENLINAVKQEGFQDVKIENSEGERVFQYGYITNGSWGSTSQGLESYCNNINK